MSIVNPLQPINLFSDMLYSILDIVSIANDNVLSHLANSLIKSINEYHKSLIEIQHLVDVNPNFIEFSGYESFYNNFGSSLDSFENLLEVMETNKDYSNEFRILYNKIDDIYTILIEIIDTVSVQEAIYLDKQVNL